MSILLIASIVGNFLLFKNAEFWREANDINEKRLADVKGLAENVYANMKVLDNKEWFQKDEDVGVVFEEMVDIINWFNDIVQNDEEVELGEPKERE